MHPADTRAVDRLLSVVPVWTGLARAADAIGLARPVLLHAGPPIVDAAGLSVPILNSAIIAVLFEGWAKTMDEAEAMIRSGGVALKPAQDHGVATPLAHVVSPSMWLQRVADSAQPDRAGWGPISGGSGPALRLGTRDPAALEHARWCNGDLAEVLLRAVGEPVDLIAIADRALTEGDDCHGRTPAATRLLVKEIDARLGRDAKADAARSFLAAAPSFFLNLWMAATKCMLSAAEGEAGSSLVTRLGGNGITTGLQVAGLPGRWFTAAAAAPVGNIAPPYSAADAGGAIGDSAILDGFGVGAMAHDVAPEMVKMWAGHLPEDAGTLAATLLAAPHPRLARTERRAGLTARRVVETGRTPLISLGIVDRLGRGRLGAGLYRPPLGPFAAATAALEQTR